MSPFTHSNLQPPPHRQTRTDSPLYRVEPEHRRDWVAFMHAQIELPDSDTRWGAMCESLQRQAHDFDAVFASAHAHQIATPHKFRLDIVQAPKGAAIFVDDPNDDNPFGHIVGKWSNSGDSDVQVVTNDVNDTNTGYDYGNVTICPLDWFLPNWGDTPRFATLWFGDGQIVPTKLTAAGVQKGRESIQAYVKRAIGTAQMVIDAMHNVLATDGIASRDALTARREIADQRKNIQDLRKLLPA